MKATVNVIPVCDLRDVTVKACSWSRGNTRAGTTGQCSAAAEESVPEAHSPNDTHFLSEDLTQHPGERGEERRKRRKRRMRPSHKLLTQAQTSRFLLQLLLPVRYKVLYAHNVWYIYSKGPSIKPERDRKSVV